MMRNDLMCVLMRSLIVLLLVLFKTSQICELAVLSKARIL